MRTRRTRKGRDDENVIPSCKTTVLFQSLAMVVVMSHSDDDFFHTTHTLGVKTHTHTPAELHIPSKFNKHNFEVQTFPFSVQSSSQRQKTRYATCECWKIFTKSGYLRLWKHHTSSTGASSGYKQTSQLPAQPRFRLKCLHLGNLPPPHPPAPDFSMPVRCELIWPSGEVFGWW